MLIEVMKNGKATEKFKEFLSNQGGDSSIVDNPEKMPQAKYVIDVPAKLQVLFLTLLQMRLVLQLCYLVQVVQRRKMKSI